MAATLPAGLLERMISLTESLIATLGDKNAPTTSAASSGYEINPGKHAIQSESEIQTEDVSGERKEQAIFMVSPSLDPADIDSKCALNIKKTSGGTCSAGCADQNKSEGVGLSESKGLKKKALIEMDTLIRQRLDDRQVMMQFNSQVS